MNRHQLDFSSIKDDKQALALCSEEFVSLEAEIPETLYLAMMDFISSNPKSDQYKIMSSAIANFLFQNGCSDRAVTERYLNDLFTRPDFV